MAEVRYCYRCFCVEHRDVRMEFYRGMSYFGTYVCPNCGIKIDKTTSGDTGEKYC